MRHPWRFYLVVLPLLLVLVPLAVLGAGCEYAMDGLLVWSHRWERWERSS